MDKMKTLQKFSSNIRYEDEPEFGAMFSENYQNFSSNFPNIANQGENEEDEVYEAEFEAITEDAKDLNTSQTGKGQSQEENSHSSNIGSAEQTNEAKSDEKETKKSTKSTKISKLKKVEEAKSSPKKKKSSAKGQNDVKVERRKVPKIAVIPTGPKVEGVRRESKLPILPPVTPNPQLHAKARLIQTADDIRMPKIDQRVMSDRSGNDATPMMGSSQGNKFAVKRPYEDMFQPTNANNIAAMYRTINSSSNPPGKTVSYENYLNSQTLKETI